MPAHQPALDVADAAILLVAVAVAEHEGRGLLDAEPVGEVPGVGGVHGGIVHAGAIQQGHGGLAVRAGRGLEQDGLLSGQVRGGMGFGGGVGGFGGMDFGGGMGGFGGF